MMTKEQKAVYATELLKTTTTMFGQKLEYPSKTPQVTATLVEFPPGAELGWHVHPNVRYVYVLKGTLRITSRRKNGMTTRDFPAGTFFVEAIRTHHNNQNIGKTLRRL
jgi:quercetin dioxygenase-like cupin family protein